MKHDAVRRYNLGSDLTSLSGRKKKYEETREVCNASTEMYTILQN